MQLRKVVKNAKKTYYQKVIEKLDSLTILNTVEWLKSVRQYTTSLLQQQHGELAISNIEKQLALRSEPLPSPVTGNSSTDKILDLYTEMQTAPIADTYAQQKKF